GSLRRTAKFASAPRRMVVALPRCGGGGRETAVPTWQQRTAEGRGPGKSSETRRFSSLTREFLIGPTGWPVRFRRGGWNGWPDSLTDSNRAPKRERFGTPSHRVCGNGSLALSVSGFVLVALDRTG